MFSFEAGEHATQQRHPDGRSQRHLEARCSGSTCKHHAQPSTRMGPRLLRLTVREEGRGAGVAVDAAPGRWLGLQFLGAPNAVGSSRGGGAHEICTGISLLGPWSHSAHARATRAAVSGLRRDSRLP